MPSFGGTKKIIRPEEIDPYRNEQHASGIRLTTDNPAAELALDAAAERAEANR